MERKNVRFFSVLLVICMIFSMIPAPAFAASASVVYLKPNSQWLTANARFAAYFFSGSDYVWVSMTDSDGDGYYAANVPTGYGSVIFCRMNPGTSNNVWDNMWNQTADLTIPTNGRNCYTMTAGSWNSGTWGTFTVTQDYYLFGYINGANYACEGDSANLGTYKFEDGKLTATFDCDSYVAVKTGDNANWYMTNGYDGNATSVTLYNTSSSIAVPEKMFVPGGVEVTFTLTVNSNDTLTLSYSTNTSGCEHESHLYRRRHAQWQCGLRHPKDRLVR